MLGRRITIYRLSFGGTRKKLYATSKKAAMDDARYWLRFGQKRVCIDALLPTGTERRVTCLERGRRR
jgi:hypothetical protein